MYLSRLKVNPSQSFLVIPEFPQMQSSYFQLIYLNSIRIKNDEIYSKYPESPDHFQII